MMKWSIIFVMFHLDHLDLDRIDKSRIVHNSVNAAPDFVSGKKYYETNMKHFGENYNMLNHNQILIFN